MNKKQWFLGAVCLAASSAAMAQFGQVHGNGQALAPSSDPLGSKALKIAASSQQQDAAKAYPYDVRYQTREGIWKPAGQFKNLERANAAANRACMQRDKTQPAPNVAAKITHPGGREELIDCETRR